MYCRVFLKMALEVGAFVPQLSSPSTENLLGAHSESVIRLEGNVHCSAFAPEPPLSLERAWPLRGSAYG